MEQILQNTGATAFLIVWGFLVGAFIAWKGAKQLDAMVTLARIADNQESDRSGPAAFKSAYVTYLLGTVIAAVVAYGWLPNVLAEWLFGLGKDKVGYAPLQVAALASTLPLAVGAVYQWRWRRRYRAAHTAYCPKCGRINDRPHFPGHHRYTVVCGYAAIMDGDRFLCRWCHTPLTFPRLAS